MDDEESKAIDRQYENFGIAVVREQAAEYKRLYAAVLKERVPKRREILWYTLQSMREWFRTRMTRFCITEASGDELADALERDVRRGNSRCRGVKANLQVGRSKNFSKGD